MKLIQKASPNCNTRRLPVSCVVLHATADHDTAASVEWCCTPKPANPNPVSYHVIVDRDGTVFSLVPTEKRAWHAGVAEFDGITDVNSCSIGLSFANANDGKEPYTDAQFAVAAALIVAWQKRYPAITDNRITTHAIIARPVGRKNDPLHFDVPRLLQLLAVERSR